MSAYSKAVARLQAVVWATAGLASATAATSSPAQAQSWTQFYVGASVGADVLTGTATIRDTLTGERARGSGPFGGDLGLTATIGMDYQVSQSIVIGAFASYDWSGVKTSAKLKTPTESASATAMDVDQMWTVAARAGVLLSRNTLLYGLAGYSWLSVDDLRGSQTIGGVTESGHITMPRGEGLTFGAGIEHRISTNVSLKAEYRYTDYGSARLFENANSHFRIDGAAQSHVTRVGAAYRFGGGDGGTAHAERERGSWNGLFAGVGLGAEAFLRDFDVKGTGGGAVGSSAEVTGLGGGNVIGTLAVGYDRQLAERLLVGAFAEFDTALTEHRVKFSSQGQSAAIDLLNKSQSWAVGGRIGYVVAPDALVYALAGFTQVDFADARFTATNGGVTNELRLPFSTLNGVTVGAGFEKMLSPNWSARAEYRYTVLDSMRVSNLGSGGDTVQVQFEPSSHAVRAMLTYRMPH